MTELLSWPVWCKSSVTGCAPVITALTSLQNSHVGAGVSNSLKSMDIIWKSLHIGVHFNSSGWLAPTQQSLYVTCCQHLNKKGNLRPLFLGVCSFSYFLWKENCFNFLGKYLLSTHRCTSIIFFPQVILDTSAIDFISVRVNWLPREALYFSIGS